MGGLGKVATSSLLMLCMAISPVGTSFIPQVRSDRPCGEFSAVSSGAREQTSSLEMNDELTRSYSDLLMF